jgi:cleavage stimulation factor subunit 2
MGRARANRKQASAAGAYSQPANGSSNSSAPAAAASSSLPPLPQGKELPPGMTATDAISQTLNTLPPAQLLDILHQMKTLATTDPARATELLNQAPQLNYAVFQSRLIMGLVSPDTIASVVEGNVAAPPAAPPAPGPAAVGYGYPGATNTPPVVPGGGYAPPPVAMPVPVGAPAPAQAPAAALGGQDPDGLVRAVMELPQETIDQLPEAERQQIMALRSTFSAQGHR